MARQVLHRFKLGVEMREAAAGEELSWRLIPGRLGAIVFERAN